MSGSPDRLKLAMTPCLALPFCNKVYYIERKNRDLYSLLVRIWRNKIRETYYAQDSNAVGFLVARQRGEINATPLPEDIGLREAREPHVIAVQRMSKTNSFDACKRKGIYLLILFHLSTINN